ncbi:MAG: GNAT family N-acetyltransferase [Chloroflexota bacterium]|nr:GNAT family N-acetyltransferase [Chloroflexota bacterium]
MIRTISPADAAAIATLSVDAGLFPPEHIAFLDEMMVNYFNIYQAKGHRCVVDEENDILLGVAYYEPALATDRTWYLTMIGVRRSLQGQGRGAALMHYVEDSLTAEGQRILLVETSGTPEFALTRKFYAKLGYDEEARVRDYYAPNDDMVLFRKELNAK